MFKSETIDALGDPPGSYYKKNLATLNVINLTVTL